MNKDDSIIRRIQGEDQERKNSTFSGGERARVALAKLLAVPRKDRKRRCERLRRRQEQLEEQVAATEVKIEELAASLTEQADDWQKLRWQPEQLDAAHRELEELLRQWTQVSEELEQAEQEEDS